MQVKGADFINRSIANNTPFLGCMRPDNPSVEWYRLNETTKEQAEILNKSGSEVFVIQAYNRTHATLYFELIAETNVFLSASENLETESYAKEYTLSTKQRSAYEQSIELALAVIKRGRLDKVVLSSRLALDCHSFESLEIQRLFTNEKSSSFRYVFSIEGGVIWVGDTPEKLLTREADYIQTDALAGTRRQDQLYQNAFNAKEFEEQGFIVNELRQRLSAFIAQVEVSDRQQVAAKSLIHLKTTLGGSLHSSFSDEEILEALHPTAAVCGFPRISAANLIATLEKHDREFYAGYLGFKSSSSSMYFVNLRCARLDTSKLELFVGAGITAQSDAEKETEEIQSKTATIMRLIADNGDNMLAVK